MNNLDNEMVINKRINTTEKQEEKQRCLEINGNVLKNNFV